MQTSKTGEMDDLSIETLRIHQLLNGVFVITMAVCSLWDWMSHQENTLLIINRWRSKTSASELMCTQSKH